MTPQAAKLLPALALLAMWGAPRLGAKPAETYTTVFLPNTAGPTPIRVYKTVDLATGRCTIRSTPPVIRSYADLDQALAREREAVRARYGALGPSLRPLFDALTTGQIAVQVSLRTPEVQYLSRFRSSGAQMRAVSRQMRHLLPIAPVEAVLHRTGVAHATTRTRSAFTCTVDKPTLARLACDPAVASVSALPTAEPSGMVLPFSELAEAALNPAAHPQDRAGQGVVTATIEGLLDTHNILTSICLANSAPLAKHLFLARDSYEGQDVQDWLCDSLVEVSSMSMGRQEGTAHSREALVMDDLVYVWPCPLFCSPAGNRGSSSHAEWQQYNGINVGSAKHWQQSSYLVDSFTCTRNPVPEFGYCLGEYSDSCGGDRELPEILAPGSHPFEPPGVFDTSYKWVSPIPPKYCRDVMNPDSYYVCQDSTEWTFPGRGTSFSAPVLNGVAARLISSNRALLAHKPDAVKMVLLLTAHDVDSAYWDPATDGHDGAGVVSAYDAVAYATSCTDLTRDPSPGPVEQGFVTGEADSSFADRTFAIRIPSSPPTGRHMRVVLVWTSNPDLVAEHNYLSDLDVGGLATGSDVYGSYSLDGSVEMFDVPRDELQPGSTYTFTLYSRTIRIPVNARARFFYYSLGWAWVADRATASAQVDPPAQSVSHSPVPDVRLTSTRLTIRLPPDAALDHSRYRVTNAAGRTVLEGRFASSGQQSPIVMALPRPVARGLYIVETSGMGGGSRAAVVVWGE